jgi:23S rRNA-/tRNA-specific pseudouridylate synthase
LVIWEPKDHKWTICSIIGRDPNNRLKMTIKNPVEWREAITHYEVKQIFQFDWKTLSLVEVTLETGRTHQIRVHMTNIGHPIIGDKVYWLEWENAWAQKHFWLGRQFLHAWKLSFVLDEKEYNFLAPLKPDIEKVMMTLKKSTDHPTSFR